MVVAPAAAAALAEDVFLVLFYQFGDDFFCLGVFDNDALGDFKNDVFSILAPLEGFGPVASVFCLHHLSVTEVDERPELRVYLKDDMAAPAAVTAVRAAFGHVFGAMEVGAAGSSVPAGTEDSDVIYEIGFCHLLYFNGNDASLDGGGRRYDV